MGRRSRLGRSTASLLFVRDPVHHGLAGDRSPMVMHSTSRPTDRRSEQDRDPDSDVRQGWRGRPRAAAARRGLRPGAEYSGSDLPDAAHDRPRSRRRCDQGAGRHADRALRSDQDGRRPEGGRGQAGARRPRPSRKNPNRRSRRANEKAGSAPALPAFSIVAVTIRASSCAAGSSCRCRRCSPTAGTRDTGRPARPSWPHRSS